MSAIRKHGESAFTISLLRECLSEEESYAWEIRMISDLKPEYNATHGGAGGLGRKFTKEALKKIGNATRSRPSPMLGRKRTEEEKKVLREHGLRNKDIWLKNYAHLGPKKSSKRVVCLETGEIFKSASATARHFNISKSMIIELCCGSNSHRKTAAGKTFKYLVTH